MSANIVTRPIQPSMPRGRGHPYGASIAEATGNDNIPKADWPQVRVFIPGWQQAKIKKAGAFERVDRVKPDRVFEEELAKDPSHTVKRAPSGITQYRFGPS